MRLDSGLLRAHAGKPDARPADRARRSADVGRSSLGRVWPLGSGLLALWLATLFAQEHALSAMVVWAALDVVAHGAAAGLCAVWLLPAFGLEPLVWAIGAGTLIDLDHAVAARSIDPLQMMSLGARPPTHSLVAALGVGILVGLWRGRMSGYAAAVGIVAHLLGDATEPAGAPLLVPVVSNPWMHISETVQVVGMLAMVLGSVALAYRARALDGATQWRVRRQAGSGLPTLRERPCARTAPPR